jgi:WhiB family redox-sensing transcriptional regulator
MDDAICRQIGIEIFFPKKGPQMLPHIAAAKKVCWRCPVRRACLDYAQVNSIEYGVWGGYTRNERRAIKRLNGLGEVRRAS